MIENDYKINEYYYKVNDYGYNPHEEKAKN